MSESVSRILELLKEKGISAYKLSKETGIGQATISSWKAGNSNPSYGALVKAAKFLNVSIEYLEGETDDPTPQQPQIFKEGETLILHLSRELSEMTLEEQQEVANYVDYLRNRNNKEK